jgi:4-amino-4-deoxy-L-arabinose transferase-like glycosyltransferase
VFLVLAELGLLIATGNGYGYHRDELYFIQAGDHPALGYDDQPPLTPLIGRVSAALFGDTPRGLRMLSALAMGLAVVLAALIARELGGGWRAQILAGAGVAAAGLMALGHLLSTATFDFLAWAILLYLVTRILRSGDDRLWLAVGTVAGVALLNKHLVLLLAASLLAGAAITRRGDLLRSRYLWAGAAIALVLWAPNLIWQADHGWPQLTLGRQISGEDPVGVRAGFLPFQIVFISPVLVPVWVAGLVWLLRNPAAGRFRMLGWGYLVLVALCLLTAGKAYYVAGYYPLLLGAGGVALEGWLASADHRALMAAGVALAAAVSATVTLPIVPERTLPDTPIPSLFEDSVETIGWPRFVDSVAAVERRAPHAVVLTGNYGEAGAIDRFGAPRGLPRAYSGHNAYWRFGRPPGRAGPVVAVGFLEHSPYLARFFPDCRVMAHVDNGLGVDNEEQGAAIQLCGPPRAPWREIWPRLRHLDA